MSSFEEDDKKLYIAEGSLGSQHSQDNINLGKSGMSAEHQQKRGGRCPGRRSAKMDVRAKLERSRQSARECRARKKLRYQYLEDLVANREKAVFALRDELEMYKQLCIQVDSGLFDQQLCMQLGIVLKDSELCLPMDSSQQDEHFTMPVDFGLSDIVNLGQSVDQICTPKNLGVDDWSKYSNEISEHVSHVTGNEKVIERICEFAGEISNDFAQNSHQNEHGGISTVFDTTAINDTLSKNCESCHNITNKLPVPYVVSDNHSEFVSNRIYTGLQDSDMSNFCMLSTILEENE